MDVAAWSRHGNARAIVGVMASLGSACKSCHVQHSRDAHQRVLEALRSLDTNPIPVLVPTIRVGHLLLTSVVVGQHSVLIASCPKEENSLAAWAASPRKLLESVCDVGGPVRDWSTSPGIVHDICLVCNVVQCQGEPRFAHIEVRPIRLPLNWQESTTWAGSHGVLVVCLGSNDTSTRCTMVGSSLVHLARIRSWCFFGDQLEAVEVSPVGKLAVTVKVLVVKVTPIVGHSHDDFRRAKAIQLCPCLLAM
mmetsp:Transcript_26902/g.37764  ORF Transcript_26902/g.37764 Transcript_26902/m.37764 type:complete len:250 (+) Transcript_26902:1498-2247(+)